MICELLLTVPNGSVGNRVTVVVADCDESACDTAVIVTVPEFGAGAGAMYSPVALIVPVEASPPALPFTCQLKAVLGLPLRVALNCRLAPTPMEGEVGLRETPAGVTKFVLPVPPPQPGENCRKTRHVRASVPLKLVIFPI